MNSEVKKIMYLLKRELFEFRTARVLTVIGIFGILQIITMLSAHTHGLMEDTIFIFLIGGLCTVIASFDLIAREREFHTIDLLLTQGISRGSLFAVKWFTTVMYSILCALVFCITTIIGTALAGHPILWQYLLREFGLITWIMEIYATIALLCSIVFRRPKSSLITALSIWVVFRPMVIGLLLIHPIKNALSLDKNGIWRFVAFLPEFAFRMGLDIHLGAPTDVTIPAYFPFVALTGYFVICSILAWILFNRQDEPVV